MIINSYIYSNPIDPDAQAFITATGITGSTANAINQLVLAYKSAGIWTKSKLIYPLVGGVATSHKFNLKDPQDTNAANRLVFAGGVTHSSSGVLFNGTNGWADTFLNMSTNFTAYDIHLSTNIYTDFVGTLAQGHIGANASATSCNRLGAPNSTSESSLLGGTSGTYTVVKTVTTTTHKGFWCGSRLSTTSHNLIDPSGTITANTTSITSTQPNLTLGLGCRRGATNDQYSGFGYSFFSAGVGLTTTEMTALKLAETNFQTALGRI
jgi:hypothetical protein